MNPSIVAQRSDSDRTACALRIAQRSQSIPIPIPKMLTKGAVEYLQSDAVGRETLPREALRIRKTVWP